MEQDTSISPDAAPVSKPDGGVYVSVASLSEDGVSPSIGDKVTVQVDGSIHSIDDKGVACVTPEMVNGEPVPTAPTETAEPTSDALRSALEGGAY